MSIANEIRALHARMVEDSQRDVDAMVEIANVFLRIDEARQRGYAQLAQVFSVHETTPAQEPAQPQPLSVWPYDLLNGEASTQPAPLATLKAMADLARQSGAGLQAQPYMTQDEASAYMRETEEAYGHILDQGGTPEDIARRFSPGPANGWNTSVSPMTMGKGGRP